MEYDIEKHCVGIVRRDADEQPCALIRDEHEENRSYLEIGRRQLIRQYLSELRGSRIYSRTHLSLAFLYSRYGRDNIERTLQRYFSLTRQ